MKHSDLPDLHLTEKKFSLAALECFNLLIVWRLLTCFSELMASSGKKSKQREICFSEFLHYIAFQVLILLLCFFLHLCMLCEGQVCTYSIKGFRRFPIIPVTFYMVF